MANKTVPENCPETLEEKFDGKRTSINQLFDPNKEVIEYNGNTTIPLTNQDFPLIKNQLQSLKAVKVLSLCNNKLCGETIEDLSKSLLHIKTLKELDLSGNEMSLQDLFSLVNILRDASVENLNISSNKNVVAKRKVEIPDKLVSYMFGSKSSFQVLNISHNKLGNYFWKTAFRELSFNEKLYKLVAVNCGVSDKAIAVLSSLLESGGKLQEIDVRENTFSADSQANLINSVQDNINITSLLCPVPSPKHKEILGNIINQNNLFHKVRILFYFHKTLNSQKK